MEDADNTETEARDFATFKGQRAPFRREDLKAGLLNVAVLNVAVLGGIPVLAHMLASAASRDAVIVYAAAKGVRKVFKGAGRLA